MWRANLEFSSNFYRRCLNFARLGNLSTHFKKLHRFPFHLTATKVESEALKSA